MSEVFNELKPGVPLTDEQKKKLAEENAKISAEAQAQAAEHRAQDVISGHGEPVVGAVANLIKDKLLNEEFQPNTRGQEPKE